MKKRTIISIFLAVFLVIGSSCSSPEKENQKSTKTESTISSKIPTATEENAPPASETASQGEKLFKNNSCVVCHQLDSKLVGPTLKDVSSAYANNKEGLITFLEGKGKAIVDPAQAALMQPQIAITSGMSAADLNTLADYILSIK